MYENQSIIDGSISWKVKNISPASLNNENWTQLSDFALVNHTHDDRYSLLTHNHDNNYLSLTGGTLTGNLEIKGTLQTLHDYNYGATFSRSSYENCICKLGRFVNSGSSNWDVLVRLDILSRNHPLGTLCSGTAWLSFMNLNNSGYSTTSSKFYVHNEIGSYISSNLKWDKPSGQRGWEFYFKLEDTQYYYIEWKMHIAGWYNPGSYIIARYDLNTLLTEFPSTAKSFTAI